MRSFLAGTDGGARERILLGAEAALRFDPTASLADVARAAGLRRRAVRAEFAAMDRVVAALAVATTSRLGTDLVRYASTGEAPDLVWTRFLDDLWMTLPSFDYLLPLGRGHRPLVEELLTPLLLRGTAMLAGVPDAAPAEGGFERTRTALMAGLAAEAEDRSPTSRAFLTDQLQRLGVPPARTADLLEALLVVRPEDAVPSALTVPAA